jgi:hypothetical protein
MPAMEETPSSPDSDSTIHIDALSDTLKNLLDCVLGLAIIEMIGIGNIIDILDLGARFGFTHLPRTIIPFMQTHATSDAWVVFELATANDFPAMAAYALDQLHLAEEWRCVGIIDMDTSLLDSIPNKYAVPLVRNMTMFITTTGATDWRKVAQNFPKLEKANLYQGSRAGQKANIRPILPILK